MKPRKLSKEEEFKIREKPFAIDKYVMIRTLNRLGFRRVEDVFEYGEIWQEGKNKFRAVLPIKKCKMVYVIFEEYPEFLEFKTCGITAKKKVWG